MLNMIGLGIACILYGIGIGLLIAIIEQTNRLLDKPKPKRRRPKSP